MPSIKNGALVFLSASHAPKARVDDVVDDGAEDKVSSRHRDEILADISKFAPLSVRLGLWTRHKSLSTYVQSVTDDR